MHYTWEQLIYLSKIMDELEFSMEKNQLAAYIW
jgi:hypothetical protein